jgi:rsbT co-antagonist protein RsbR
MAVTMPSRRGSTTIADVIEKNETHILQEWMQEMAGSTRRSDLMKESELRSQCASFLSLLRDAARSDGSGDIQSAPWGPIRDLLGDLSRSRALQGFSPSETATFVLSVKKPLFIRLRQHFGNDADGFADEVWTATALLDKLGLYTTEVFIKAKEEIISRQQQDMMELSTPVVKLWDGILGLPIIGTLDSARTQVVMESLLQKIVETNSSVAIIDITGVPTVDTLVAQHLIKTVTAARLMGADCIISGVRPQIAQTIVHLGVNLLDVVTKASLSDAFALALRKTGFAMGRAA